MCPIIRSQNGARHPPRGSADLFTVGNSSLPASLGRPKALPVSPRGQGHGPSLGAPRLLPLPTAREHEFPRTWYTWHTMFYDPYSVRDCSCSIVVEAVGAERQLEVRGPCPKRGGSGAKAFAPPKKASPPMISEEAVDHCC